jgi:RNA polymerase sigma-70 factor (TIGR02943 family)
MGPVSEAEKYSTVKEWVLEYSDSLYTRALNRTSSVEIAEDLLQETFIAAFAAFDGFQNKSNVKTWLTSILNNKIIDHYRNKSNRHQSLDQLEEEKAFHMTDSMFDSNGKWNLTNQNAIWEDEKHILDDEDFNAAMKLCMDDLPVQWRIAISSKYLLEKETAEICQELGLSASNYWQIMHRAKLLLKKCIEMHWKI